MNSSIVYQVNLDVAEAIGDAYESWLTDHVRDMLKLPGFVSAEIFAEEVEPGLARRRWCVQYRLIDRASLQAYFDQHAARMRADGLNRFGNHFSASRRIMFPALKDD